MRAARSDETWIQTFAGRQFWPLEPHAEEVFIDDIAHALAHQCRFTGHCRAFYSVAQHSVLVSRQAPRGVDALYGLLHDAAEAYLVDVASTRASPEFAAYRAAESRLMGVICARYGLAPYEPAWVTHADRVLLATECRDLMAPPPSPWLPLPPPLEEQIEPWPPERAERAFMQRFIRLSDGGAP